MKNINQLYSEYLKKIGALTPVSLGGTRDIRRASKSENIALENAIKLQMQINLYMIILSMLILAGIFIAGLTLMIHHKDQLHVISIISVTTILFLGLILIWSRKLWIEKNLMDMSRAVLQNLPPADAAKFIETIYWNLIQKR